MSALHRCQNGVHRRRGVRGQRAECGGFEAIPIDLEPWTWGVDQITGLAEVPDDGQTVLEQVEPSRHESKLDRALIRLPSTDDLKTYQILREKKAHEINPRINPNDTYHAGGNTRLGDKQHKFETDKLAGSSDQRPKGANHGPNLNKASNRRGMQTAPITPLGPSSPGQSQKAVVAPRKRQKDRPAPAGRGGSGSGNSDQSSHSKRVEGRPSEMRVKFSTAPTRLHP